MTSCSAKEAGVTLAGDVGKKPGRKLRKPGKTMGKRWKNMGKSWENDGEMLDLENMGKSWDNEKRHGNTREFCRVLIDVIMI